MEVEFSHADLVNVLKLINQYKTANKAFDNNLLHEVIKYLKKYKLPEYSFHDPESHLETLLNWPSRHLFTYGTLMPGQVNNAILKYTNGYWEDGFVRGNLSQIGWGIEYGYPALYWHPNGSIINGKLLIANEIDWKVLDQLEGKDYERSWVIVHTGKKGMKVANCYTIPNE